MAAGEYNRNISFEPGAAVSPADPQRPFTLNLADGPVLACRQVLRRLPGQRLVCRASWQDRPVLAKIYQGRKARRHARREALAARALEDTHLGAPRLLANTTETARGWPVLLFEWLEAEPFDQAWARASQIRHAVFMETLLVLMARLHQSGLEPRDPHLDNFLVDAHGGIHPVDAGGYRLHAGALPFKDSVNNLGLLLAQFPPGICRSQARALAIYAEARQWPAERLNEPVVAATRRWRAWRARKLGEKSLRNCSEFRVRVRDGLRLYERRELPEALVDGWVTSGGLVPGGSEPLLKNGRSQTVWRTHLGGRAVVVKRYNVTGLWQRLRRLVGGSRARRAWVGAHWLRALGIDTPRPLLMVEERRAGGRAWLVTEPGRGRPAQRVFGGTPARADLEPLTAVVETLGELGLVHGDLKASNFLVDGRHVQLIDLDSLRWPRSHWRRRRGHARDRKRFWANWRPGA